MKRFVKKLKIVAVALLLPLTITSCLDSFDSSEQAFGDALIRVFYEGDSLVYNVQLFAYSYTKMNEVTAKGIKDSITIRLDSTSNKYSYAYLPPRETYSPIKPEATWYSFNITFESGNTMVVADYLYPNVISPPQLTKIEPDMETDRLLLTWKNVNNAHYFKILLMDTDRNIVFESPLLDTNSSAYSISGTSHGWYNGKTFEPGNEYLLAINAYLFEPVASSFDIQCIATNDKHSFVWE